MQNGNYIQQNISDVFLSNAEMFIYTLYPLISPRNIFRINVKPIVMLPMKKNNVNFERELDEHYHSSSYRTHYEISDNACLDIYN